MKEIKLNLLDQCLGRFAWFIIKHIAVKYDPKREFEDLEWLDNCKLVRFYNNDI